MKKLLSVLVLLLLFSCKQNNHDIEVLQDRIKVLEGQLANSYKPGFGELMSSVQAHHAKLWFAGAYKNWKLAEFEVHEIKEILENVKKYQKDREESLLIDMMDPSIENILLSIKNEDVKSFTSSYKQLTKTCNTCHLDTKFEYNIVKIPDVQQFSNQGFKMNP